MTPKRAPLLIRVPLAGDATSAADEALPQAVERVSIGFDSWGEKPFGVWLDGMRFE